MTLSTYYSPSLLVGNVLSSVTNPISSGKFNFPSCQKYFPTRKYNFRQGNRISHLYYSISHIAYSIFHLGNSISQMESFISYLANAKSHLFIQFNHISNPCFQRLHSLPTSRQACRSNNTTKVCQRKRMLNKSAKPK